MKYLFSIILVLFTVFMNLADRRKDNQELLNALGNWNFLEMASLDTILNHNGYNIRCIIHDSEIDHIGLNLFNDEIKEGVDKEMLDYVETMLLADILGIELSTPQNYQFFRGDRTDLKDVSPDVPCMISNLNSQYLSFEWDFPGNKTLRMDVPISYEKAYRGNRSEVENSFIKRIKDNNYRRTLTNEDILSKFQPYGEKLYIIPGQTYINKDINRNVFIRNDSINKPVWTIEYPIESISNLFIYPSETYGQKKVELTILKHEYGEKESIDTTLDNLMEICGKDGCIPFWGLENFDGETLLGSLFLYNWKHGYDHVLKIECNPQEVINGDGIIFARASLFIPTNNIDTLYQPYKKKSEDEKIKYWED